MMYLIDYWPEKAIVDTVDAALKGSEFAIEAWGVMRKCLRERRKPTGEEYEQVDELLDRACDDLEGPELRVDFSKDRIYS